MNVKAVALVLFAWAGVIGAAQQPAAPATRMISGVVTTANDSPLPRVRVGSSAYGNDPGMLTDARGQFTIRVPAANSRLTFTKAGYITHTADVPAQTEPWSAMRVRLLRGGVLGGQVMDTSGARVMHARVTARRVGAPASDTRLSTQTNDLGEFRFGGLAEGAYALTVRPPEISVISGPPESREEILNAFVVSVPATNVRTGSEANVSVTLSMPPFAPPGLGGKPLDFNPETTGSLSGRVVGQDGLPIAGATVRVYRSNTLSRTVQTDERGRYSVDLLSPGPFVVEASKLLYMDRQYGQVQREAGRTLELRAGQRIESIDITLTRGGVIAGTIVDEFGEPMQGVAVNPLEIAFIDGRRRAMRVSTLGQVRTDDRGQYRLYGLFPGTYLVQAQVIDAVSGGTGYAPAYYPGTPSADQAQPTRVDFGVSATAIDFTLAPTSTYRVTGTLLDSTGTPARGVLLLSVSGRSGAIQADPFRTTAFADGSFVFSNVPPGDYAVQATSNVTTRGDPALGGVTITPRHAMSYVTVIDREPAPLRLQVSEGATLTGRIRYEGVQPGQAPRLTMNAVTTDVDRNPQAGFEPVGLEIRPDGTFEYKGVFGPVLLSVQPVRTDWYARSATFRGQNLLDTPFDFGVDGTFRDIELVISAPAASVTGRVTDDRGAPVSNYRVFVFSTFRDQWFSASRWVRTVYPVPNGNFAVAGLPPGEYFVAAIERGDDPAPPDAAMLESLSARAVRMTLGEGQLHDVALRIVRR